MVDQKIEQEVPSAVNSVENALSSLWEKAREASYLITTLRDEKKKLQQHVTEVEEELSQVKNELVEKQSQLLKLREDSVQVVNKIIDTPSSVGISEDEKRLIQQKIKNIISKLDQYLTP